MRAEDFRDAAVNALSALNTVRCLQCKPFLLLVDASAARCDQEDHDGETVEPRLLSHVFRGVSSGGL